MLGYTQALLGEYFHNIKGPAEMLWSANLWAKTVQNNELPEYLIISHAHSKELAEELCLHGHQPNAVRHPVLDVLGDVKKVLHLVFCIKQFSQLFVILNGVHHCDIDVVVVGICHSGAVGGRWRRRKE
jgi:hypothetical protein